MKIKRKKMILTTLLVFSLLIVISSAFIIQGNQKMTGVISEGGGISITGGGVYKSHVVVGQPVIGVVQSSNYEVCLGVMCTKAFQTEYYININGWLTYNNGNIANNAVVNVTITYQSSQFEITNTTDNNGYFSVRFTNLPEFLFLPSPGKLLDIKIYANGQVEALYECTYDPSTQICA